MHTEVEQKVWSNWSLRQQNYLNYPTQYFVITWLHTYLRLLFVCLAKFHYAIWFKAGRRQVRSWSLTSFEPVATSFEPVCDQLWTR